MKKIFIQFLLMLMCCVSVSSAFSLSDDFYTTGEDLEYMFEADSNFAIEELEYKLRKFVLFRKLEDLIFDLNNEYPAIGD